MYRERERSTDPKLFIRTGPNAINCFTESRNTDNTDPINDNIPTHFTIKLIPCTRDNNLHIRWACTQIFSLKISLITFTFKFTSSQSF